MLGHNNIELLDDKAYRLNHSQMPNQRPSLTAKTKSKTKSRSIANCTPKYSTCLSNEFYLSFDSL